MSKLQMARHDIRTTLALLENAFNGVIEHPESRAEYKSMFIRGKERILREVDHMLSTLDVPDAPENETSNLKSEI